MPTTKGTLMYLNVPYRFKSYNILQSISNMTAGACERYTRMSL